MRRMYHQRAFVCDSRADWLWITLVATRILPWDVIIVGMVSRSESESEFGSLRLSTSYSTSKCGSVDRAALAVIPVGMPRSGSVSV
jgi:hypothetical protein